jgi:UDP-glucose 4-epimerase
MSKILVTGGAGYIGRVICERLQKDGHEIFVLDNFSNSFREGADKFGYVWEADILDTHALKVGMPQVDAVVHLAALAVIGGDPVATYENNVTGTINILKAMKAVDCSRIVFASSAAVYAPYEVAKTEQSTLGPCNTYGRSKLIAEDIIRDLGMHYTSFRMFNVCGETPTCKERRVHETHLIPSAIKARFSGNLLTLTGNAKRSYVHVSDVADAFAMALDGRCFYKQVFNVCSEIKLYNLPIVHEINMLRKQNQTHMPVHVHCAQPRSGDPEILIGSSARLQKLGWKPKYNSIRDILKTYGPDYLTDAC